MSNYKQVGIINTTFLNVNYFCTWECHEGEFCIPVTAIRSEVSLALESKIMVFWVMTLCSLAGGYQCFIKPTGQAVQ